MVVRQFQDPTNPRDVLVTRGCRVGSNPSILVAARVDYPLESLIKEQKRVTGNDVGENNRAGLFSDIVITSQLRHVYVFEFRKLEFGCDNITFTQGSCRLLRRARFLYKSSCCSPAIQAWLRVVIFPSFTMANRIAPHLHSDCSS